MNDSIFIVINSGKTPANSQRLIEDRVKHGADFLRLNRLTWAQINLPIGVPIVMYQCGGKINRVKYPGASCFVAAGSIKEAARIKTPQDEVEYNSSWKLQSSIFGAGQLVGIVIYQFPKGIVEPLLGEDIFIHLPNQGANFIEVDLLGQKNKCIKPGGYIKLVAWWNSNSGGTPIQVVPPPQPPKPQL